MCGEAVGAELCGGDDEDAVYEVAGEDAGVEEVGGAGLVFVDDCNDVVTDVTFTFYFLGVDFKEG